MLCHILNVTIKYFTINIWFIQFLVEDNEVIEKEQLPFDYSSDYWEKRYIIRREKIPIFLERVADVILLTGKYLNVIRQCGKLTCQTGVLILYLFIVICDWARLWTIN
jgi:gamma-tubulin complex component 2